MNKLILAAMCILAIGNIQAQNRRVGINTESPKATLHIEKNKSVEATQPQGVLYPRLTTEERAKFAGVEEGTMIYNTTKKCVELFKGLDSGGDNGWHCSSCDKEEVVLDKNIEKQGDIEIMFGGWCGFIDYVSINTNVRLTSPIWKDKSDSQQDLLSLGENDNTGKAKFSARFVLLDENGEEELLIHDLGSRDLNYSYYNNGVSSGYVLDNNFIEVRLREGALTSDGWIENWEQAMDIDEFFHNASPKDNLYLLYKIELPNGEVVEDKTNRREDRMICG